MNATTVQNVVTYNTIIDFDNPEMKLFPGMTAYITIPVASAIDVLRVPNSALRYKPDLKAEEIRALYKKFGIENAGESQLRRRITRRSRRTRSRSGTLKQVNHAPAGRAE